MKKFSIPIFMAAFIGINMLLLSAFIGAAAIEEGTAESNIIAIMLSKIFLVLRFPTHSLLWPVVTELGVLAYFGGLLFNCLFYALIIERVIIYFKAKRSKRV